MVFKKALLGLAAVAVLALGTAAFATPASAAYYGGWYYNDNPGGWDVLQLGDGHGRYLHLIGTEVSCGDRGAPYAQIHQVLSDGNDASRDGFVTWWVVNTCDGQYDHICVQNDWGNSACSTYQIDGWYNWRNDAN